MSGVMTKVAVYGFVRIVFDLLGPPAWWWSMVVLVARRRHRGARRALRADAARPEAAARLPHGREHRHHLHRPRPGARLRGQRDAGFAAALALTAALFHVLNHSLFKSLLFFGAGAVLIATGERDMERLGGLIHRMPLTAFAFLVGSRGDLGPAAAQRLRLRMADLPGDPGEPRRAAMGAEAPGAGGRRDAGAVGGAGRRLLRQGVRHHVPRPAARRGGRARRARPTASRSPRCSRSPGCACSPGVLPGLRDRRAGAGRARPLVGARLPAQSDHCLAADRAGRARARSSYNGLLVFAVHRGLGRWRRPA